MDSGDNNGNVTGSAYGNAIIGFWDDSAQKLTFMRVIDPSNVSTMQIFTGFLFTSAGTPTFAGMFQAFSGGWGNPVATSVRLVCPARLNIDSSVISFTRIAELTPALA